MESSFVPVTTPEALARLFADADGAPVILFLYDPYCGASTRARQELASVSRPVYLVDVAAAPHLTRRIALRTGVRHESPQVLVLRDGEAVWHASHRAITAAAVTAAVGASAAPVGGGS